MSASYTPEEAKLRRLERQVRACEVELAEIRDGRDPIKRRGPAKGTPRKRFLRDHPELVREMHAVHLQGVNLRQLCLQFGYQDANIKKAFERLGLEVRLDPTLGRIQKSLYYHSESELLEIARRKVRRVAVPAEVRQEWREWDLAKRWWFIQEMVKVNEWPEPMPEGPYSANVKPFTYGTPEAHEMAARMNEGLPSREWLVHLKITSRGVIYDGKLWFWTKDYGYVHGRFVKGKPRQVLHRVIYEHHHGTIPADGVVRPNDGNANNLDPQNWRLETRNDLARENQARHITKISRLKTAALLNLKPNNHHESAILFGSSGRGRRGQNRAA